ncbi:MAG: BamA/TamA family outer membrane protein, partial [Gammaproteobacteria bacterium]|nr:BamA/TamA family outer membrane protein [Gammaproteobacteria bacterium]
ERLRISEAEAGLDFGRRLGYSGELRLGIYRGIGETRVKIGGPDRGAAEFDAGGVLAQLRFDTLDNAHFPRHGIKARLRWNSSVAGLGADNEFDTFAGDILSTWSRGRSSFQVGISYATTNDGTAASQDLFPLGGFRRLSGLTRNSISGPHAALAKLVYYRRMRESTSVFDVPIYLGASLEAGNVWQSRSAMSMGSAIVNGSVYAGLDTYIGPLFVGAGLAEGGDSSFFLLIGARPR